MVLIQDQYPSKEDKLAILNNGPYLLEGQVIYLKDWEPNFDLEKRKAAGFSYMDKSLQSTSEILGRGGFSFDWEYDRNFYQSRGSSKLKRFIHTPKGSNKYKGRKHCP